MPSLPYILWTVATGVCCIWWLRHAVRDASCGLVSSPPGGDLSGVWRDLTTPVETGGPEGAALHSHSPRTDPLTGLSNDFALQETLRRMFALMSRYGHSFSVVLVDLDHSDSRSQPDCEQRLCDLAQLLNSAIREMDSVYRLPGLQLAVLLPETSLEGAVTFAQRVHREVWEQLHVRVSIGLSSARDDDGLRSLSDRMAVALYAAQSDGGRSIYRHTGQHIEAVGGSASSCLENTPVCSG